jgi:protein-L-isoaspartate(D-aspartate) O-methyltransferase
MARAAAREWRAGKGVLGFLIALLAAGLAAAPATAQSEPAAGQAGAQLAQAGGSFDISAIEPPPLDDRQAFIEYMTGRRGEDAQMLGWRFDRMQRLVGNGDLWRDKEIAAFLLAPREIFALARNRARAYDHAYLDIGYGVTISGPHIVGRMTSALDLEPGDRVLEIGTGSGYQAAILSYLTDEVYSIEIIEPLAERTAETYADLAEGEFPEYGNIRTMAADGYHGWEEHAPYDGIIVTAAIDHIPPPLLQQLAVGGTMVIPVGPLGAQTLLAVTKTEDGDGNIRIEREDIYQGRRTVSFVPFTRAD